MWEIVWYIVNTQEVLIQKCSPPLSDRTFASCREFNNLYKLLSFYCPSQETLHFELPSSFLYHRSCKMLFYIPVSQTVEVRRATFCLIWILTFPESPSSTFWKLFPGQSAAFISICHSILTFSLLAHFSSDLWKSETISSSDKKLVLCWEQLLWQTAVPLKTCFL